MFRSLTTSTVLAAALLVGCGNETSISVVDASVVVSPQLSDLGTVPVGEASEFTIDVFHDQGAIVDVNRISLVNVTGDFFSYQGEEGKQTLEPQGTLSLPLVYQPLEEGYHRATVEIATNAREQTIICLLYTSPSPRDS